MSCRTAWTNGSTCGGASAVTSGAATPGVADNCVGRASCLDGDVAGAIAGAIAVGCGVSKAVEGGRAAVADGVAASGLPVGSGCGVAGGTTATDAVAEEAFAVDSIAEEAPAVDAIAEEGFAVAVSVRTAGAGAVMRPATNPIPMRKAVTAARTAQVGRWLRKGERVSESGCSAATTGGNATTGGACVEDGKGTAGLAGGGLALGGVSGSDGLAATVSTGSGSAMSSSGSTSAACSSGSVSAACSSGSVSAACSADAGTAGVGVAVPGAAPFTGALAVVGAGAGTGAGRSSEACVTGAVDADRTLWAGGTKEGGLMGDEPAAGGLDVVSGLAGSGGGRLTVGLGGTVTGGWEGRIVIVKSPLEYGARVPPTCKFTPHSRPLGGSARSPAALHVAKRFGRQKRYPASRARATASRSRVVPCPLRIYFCRLHKEVAQLGGQWRKQRESGHKRRSRRRGLNNRRRRREGSVLTLRAEPR
jgi:hypothetical protein